ncbi:MAG: S-layer homology domain-containing protein [Elainellaceae cyanobacterium]
MSDRPFLDLESHWAKDCVMALAERNLIQGYDDQTFRPEQPITRAEFSALLKRVFPAFEAVRSAAEFLDVPESHWAFDPVTWAVERGFFAGYPDDTFHPDELLARSPALAVLSSGLKLGETERVDQILAAYFDDEAQIELMFRQAIATATLNQLVVNVPDVRKLRPLDEVTRAEVAAFIAQALDLPGVPPQFIVWSLQLSDLPEDAAIPFEELRSHSVLTRQIQLELTRLGLYVGSSQIDGLYGGRTEVALLQFIEEVKLPNGETRLLDRALAKALIKATADDFKLVAARKRQQVFQDYYAQEAGLSAHLLAFLDRGYGRSPYVNEINAFPDRLKEIPNGQDLVAPDLDQLTAFPNVGKVPTIDETGLSFLHSDIKQACVCLLSNDDGVRSRWLGRNALKNVECWSTTKILTILNVACQANAADPSIDLDTCKIRVKGHPGGYGFHDIVRDIFTYESRIASSNSLAYMLKQFQTPLQLDSWVKDITGNRHLSFQGRYGEPAFMTTPELWDERARKVILAGNPNEHLSGNSVSLYDLTRTITMLGWHHHLTRETRLPGAQWDTLEGLVRAFATDKARYLDAAIARLGLDSVIRSPVIISKLGDGRSSIRDRAEIVYVAFCQFVDKRPKAEGKPPKQRAIALGLLSAIDFGGDYDREATHLDARMAAEVTEILRRVVTDDWLSQASQTIRFGMGR